MRGDPGQDPDLYFTPPITGGSRSLHQTSTVRQTQPARSETSPAGRWEGAATRIDENRTFSVEVAVEVRAVDPNEAKKGNRISAIPLMFLVAGAGFEPATFGL